MKLLLDQNLSPRLREALQQFTIPYSQPVSTVIPAQVGIQAPDRWMPDKSGMTRAEQQSYSPT